MRKLLSLHLALFAAASLILSALPASAQQQQFTSISQLKEQYHRLLRIELDPSTPPEVKEKNRTFLEERRAQLGDAIRTRIGALRKYHASVSNILTAREAATLDESIRSLERDLAELQQPSGPAAAEQQPAARPRPRRSRRQGRAPQLTTASLAPADGGALSGAQSQGSRYGQPDFVGEPINLNVEDADIRDILNYITEQFGVAFAIDTSIDKVPVTIKVTEVPWNVALDSILKAKGLGIKVMGDVLRVVPTSSPAPAAPPTPAIEIGGPDAGVVRDDDFEVKLTLNDETLNLTPRIKKLSIEVKANGKTIEGNPAQAVAERGTNEVKLDRIILAQPSAGKPVETTLTVFDTDLPDDAQRKSVKKWTYTPRASEAAGSGGNGGLSFGPGDPARFFERPMAGENVRISYQGERSNTYQFLRNYQNVGNAVQAGFSGVVSTIFPLIEEGDAVGVMLVVGGQSQPDTYAEVKVDRNISIAAVQNEGTPVGFLVGGAVLSQQAEEFQQSDPFFGFIAGYRSKLHGKVSLLEDDNSNFTAKRVRGNEAEKKKKKRYMVLENLSLADEYGYLIESEIDGTPKVCVGVALPQCTDAGDFTYVTAAGLDNIERRVRARDKQLYPRDRGFSGGWRWNLRFQGVFDAAPRTATATEDAADGGGTTNQDPFKFIASRKAFDVQAHASIDFWPRNFFSIGPYIAWGAHTVLDKNELEGETVSPDADDDGQTDDDEVRSRSRSDNDIKQYREYGAMINLDLFNRNLFIQNILAYGWYEGLKDLDPGDATNPGNDTRNRFIGRLRIFPGGLNKRFGSVIRPIPMFGVDLNAGNGPDHLKFFTGFALAIRGITP